MQKHTLFHRVVHSWSWLLGILLVVLLPAWTICASQVISSYGFAYENGVIVQATVLEVRESPLAQPPPAQIGPVTECKECRARVVLQDILKESTRLLTNGDTITVSYSCGCWTRMPSQLMSVDSDGDSLYVASVWAECGSEGYRLVAGESILLGLEFKNGEYRPGRGGFRADSDWTSIVREELARNRDRFNLDEQGRSSF